MRPLLCALLRWFPQRKFLFPSDGGYGTHPLERFASRPPRLTRVSKFYKDANLHNPPPKRTHRMNGRPRIKGRKQPSPEAVVAKTRRQRLNVSWYGGGRRQVAVVTGMAHWYKQGEGLVPVRWVFVEVLTGTHRDEYFFTTDVDLMPKPIIEAYTGHWAIEVTFEEAREHLGLETTRGCCAQTILLAEPCLFVVVNTRGVVVLGIARTGTPGASCQLDGKCNADANDFRRDHTGALADLAISGFKKSPAIQLSFKNS